jgi:hypothetical protein
VRRGMIQLAWRFLNSCRKPRADKPENRQVLC